MSRGLCRAHGDLRIMPVTSTIKEMVMKNATADEIEKQAKSEGMLSMIEDGIFKASQGVTTIEEVLRVITGDDTQEARIARREHRTSIKQTPRPEGRGALTLYHIMLV